MNEERKIVVEEVEAVSAPPRARVEDLESPGAKLERKRDYLDGFLQQKPQDVAPDQPGGSIYDGVIAALKDIFDPESPVNTTSAFLGRSTSIFFKLCIRAPRIRNVCGSMSPVDER